MNNKTPDVSIITPIHNGDAWINDCMESILGQTVLNSHVVQVSIYDDASTDKTWELVQIWKTRVETIRNISLVASKNTTPHPKGVGYSKNQAVNQSSGNYLCFQDVIIGSNFERLPKDSTVRFTRWANSLKEEQLYRQIYTSHGPTLIMPTWFCNRKVFERVGGFSESGKGTPEDLIFFYCHLDHDGRLFKVPRCLLVYRYHPGATTFSIDEKTIWNIRVKRLQEKVLIHWPSFTIWNAGKQGRHFYKSLGPLFQEKVAAFCDVDAKKVGKYYAPYEKGAKNYPKIPIIHFKDSTPPLIICVKLVRYYHLV
uniref:Glycosyltransferase 2-like domain-containing protein n=1 Tax=Timema genevievae TaxID=629358 RepID=A0A7R9K4L4_TIMGE|nr:unnamed protein product [Timema genevievae]